jgi:site-specific DNA recombinase
LVEKWVAGYSRRSNDPEDKRVSVENGIEVARELAEQHFPGIPLRVFSDNDLTAADPDVFRPGYHDMLNAIRAGGCVGICTRKQNRLVRQGLEGEELYLLLNLAGIRQIHTRFDGVVPVEPDQLLITRMRLAVDADMVAKLKKEARDAHRLLAKQGRPSGGRNYGYRWGTGDDRRSILEIEPDQAAVIRRIVDDLLAGHSANAIADALNVEGVPTPRNGRGKVPIDNPIWRGQSVLAIARRPAIAGRRTHHGKDVGQAQWDPIITPERFEALQAAVGSAAVLDGNGKRRPANRKQRSTTRKWLLTGGLARCGLCDAPLSVGKQIRPNGYVTTYTCSSRGEWGKKACGKVSVAPAEIVEALVIDAVHAKLAEHPDMAARLAAGDDPERVRLAEEAAAADARVSRANALFGAGAIEEDEWEEQRMPAKAQAAAARAALAAFPTVDTDLPPLDLIVSDWEGLTLRQRQAVLRLFLYSLKVMPRTGRRPADPRVRVAERLDPHWRA